jgi:molybdenum cofactor cytidylyltransferase
MAYDWCVLPALVLAAGASTRMGTAKALLTAPDGQAFVVRIVGVLAAAGLRDVGIVTGRHHEEIVDVLAIDPPPVLHTIHRNPDPSRGQLSSLWTGMEAVVTPSTEGLLVTLVDVPMVSVETVMRVIEAWRRTRAPIVRPAIGERHGHPVIFDRQAFDALRDAPLDAGAKAVVRMYAADVLDVPVADEGCLVDIDTPRDYEALRGKYIRPRP